MKSKYLFPLALASFLIVLQPAWASPFTSKSQNTSPADNTVTTADNQPKKCAAKKCCARRMNHPNAQGQAQCRADGMQHHPGMGHQGMERFMKNMSAEDRARFKSIHEKLKSNPDVMAARDAVKNADSKDAKRAAFKKLHEVKRAAMSDEDRAFMDGLRQKMQSNKDGKKCHQCTHG